VVGPVLLIPVPLATVVRHVVPMLHSVLVPHWHGCVAMPAPQLGACGGGVGLMEGPVPQLHVYVFVAVR
jgi:hypothetical protein